MFCLTWSTVSLFLSRHVALGYLSVSFDLVVSNFNHVFIDQGSFFWDAYNSRDPCTYSITLGKEIGQCRV